MLREGVKKYLVRGALVIVLLFVLWQVSPIVLPFKRIAVSSADAGWSTGAYISGILSSVQIFFTDKQKLVAENENLQNALRVARLQMISAQDLARENEELKKILGRESRVGGVLGVVLSHPGVSPYDIFLIDVGEREGIRVGSLVVFENALLGVVDTVYARHAKVRLFSSSGTELPVRIGKKQIPAVTHGKGGGMFEIKIPHDINVAEGDTITYPSIRNYTVGAVSRIASTTTSTFQTIEFRAPINIFTAKFVTVTDDLILLVEEQ